MPDLIQTAMGGKRMARRPRKMSPLHMILNADDFGRELGDECSLVAFYVVVDGLIGRESGMVMGMLSA